MHLRVSRVQRGGKLYEYAQLVESFRRPSDGMPAHRVVANLGRRSAEEISNLRVALEASRQGRKVVVARSARRRGSSPGVGKPQQNLRYLDVAVLWELWQQLQLPDVLDELLPAGGCEVLPSKVVAALALQRCVDPGSKLYAQRWFPRTALVELLDVSPKSFNNTRIHRVLEDLEQATPALMKRLPRLYLNRDAAFASFFLDVTDTWFVGNGPELAERSKTKEGLVLKKVGIVLMCNERGYPLRWKVVPGKQSDSVAMIEMVRSVEGLRWLGQAPLVCDRAMGNTSQIRDLLRTGVRFLTALTLKEFGSYASGIPHQPFAALGPGEDDKSEPSERAATVAQDAGMKRVAEDLFVLDLGIVERPGDQVQTSEPAVDVDTRVQAMRLGRMIKEMVDDGRADSYFVAGRTLGLKDHQSTRYVQLCRLPNDIQEQILAGALSVISVHELLRLSRLDCPEQQRAAFERYLQQTDKTIEAMRLARSLKEAIDERRASSVTAAGCALGLKKGVTFKLYHLRKLPDDVQHQILDGKAVGLLLNDLVRIAKMADLEAQRADFERLVQQAVARGRDWRRRRTGQAHALAAKPAKPCGVAIRVRAVAYFNPARFVLQRQTAHQQVQEVELFVERLNAQLASPHSKRDRTKITSHVDARLRRDALLDAFEVKVGQTQTDGRPSYSVTLSLKAKEWARRRRYDGFSVLIAHPELPHSAEELCRLYRAKDTVEKDFQIIKSFTKLRPIRHRTDVKVRAHVTVCMLALLLERTLKDRLAGLHASGAALELLRDCNLNRYSLEDGSSAYTVTEPADEHDAILRALRMQHLIDDVDIADRIRPR